MGRREVDIAIKDTHQMDCLLKFLIRKLRTVDGKKGTANALLSVMNKEAINKHKKDNNKELISDSVKLNLIQKNEHKLFRSIYMKYLIMRIRSKISFIALRKRMSIVELFVTTI